MSTKTSTQTTIKFRGFELAVLALATLKTDKQFQRRYDPKHADKMKAEWLEAACLPLVCVRHKGRLICIDGQHRLKNLRELGYEEWMCVIINGLDDQDIYKVFDLINGRGKLGMHAIELFRFALRYGDPKRVAIWEVAVTKYKFHIPLEKDEAYGKSTIAAIRALENVFDKHGQRTGLERLFYVIKKCFVVKGTGNHLQKGTGEYYFLQGLAKFCMSTDMPMDAVVQRLTSLKITAGAVVDETGKRVAVTGKHGGNSLAKTVAEVFDDIMATKAWREVKQPALVGAGCGDDEVAEFFQE